MKLFQDYKKQFSAILILLLLTTPAFFIHAQSVTDVQNQINQKNTDITSLEQQIASYQAQLDTLDQQKTSLAQSLSELALTNKQLNAQISLTQNKIDETNLTIKSLSSDIGDKETAISNSLNSIAQEIKDTDEIDQNSFVGELLSEDNFSSVWNDLNSAVTIRDTIKEDINTLQTTKTQLEGTKTATISAQNDLVTLKSQLSDQQKITLQNTNEKNKLLAQTKDSEANYQKLVTDGLAQKTALQKEIDDYQSQLKYILDPSSLPSGGVLSWPLDSIIVTNLFGKNSSGIYASGLHDGVDFRASIGTPVKAMADGVVAGTGDTDTECPADSFGNFILIKYNNGLASTFGHLSLIKVSVGEVVTKGQIVGLSGYTGYVYPPGPGGAHLHVSLYPSNAVNVQSLPSIACVGKILTQPIAPINAYLDPLVYLPATTQSMFKSTIIKPD